MGVAAVATAALGAADLGENQLSAVAAPAISGPAPRVQHATAERRAEVVEATRSHTRTELDVSEDTEVRAATREAAMRARALTRVDRAATERSADIERELARQRRQEARQRRIERLNGWQVPVSGEITATFGAGGGMWESSHTGLDFAASEGVPVASAAAGEVASTGYDGSYGNKVVVTHDDGTQTWYCHLSSISVEPGESVAAGSTVGAVGSTGNSTGSHLHLEVHPGGGAPVDPYSFLASEGAL